MDQIDPNHFFQFVTVSILDATKKILLFLYTVTEKYFLAEIFAPSKTSLFKKTHQK